MSTLETKTVIGDAGAGAGIEASLDGAAAGPADLVGPELARLESVLTDDSGVDFPLVADLLRYAFAGGGKRLRPVVVFLTARLGDADPAAVTRLAAAVETLHTATLVHDDLVDGARLRRGLPTMNARWQAGATVLAGDWLFARAARFAAETGSVRVMEIFARTLGTLTDGELRQLFGRSGLPSRAEYDYRIYAKTASLFEAAAEATAALLSLGTKRIEALARYGRELGSAFQVVDDILDFTGAEDRLGKPVGSDLRSGQVTLPALLYLEAHPEAGAWLRAPREAGEDAPAADAAAVDALVAAIRADQASLSAAREAAKAHAARAIETLAELPPGEARDGLAAVAELAVSRDH